MVPEKKMNDFVSRLGEAAGANLESVILFGSAAAGDYHPEFSNVNLFCRDSRQLIRGLAGAGPCREMGGMRRNSRLPCS